MKLGKYMTVYPVGTGGHETYIVKDRRGQVIGAFEWYSRWRQYVFSPDDGAVFSHDCLTEIASFCKRPTAAKEDSTRLTDEAVNAVASNDGDLDEKCEQS